MLQRSLIRSGLISLQTKLIGVPTIGLNCDSTQILPDLNHNIQLLSPCNQDHVSAV